MRRVLDARLSSVVHHLGKALKEPFEDPEHIHQVRVSVREPSQPWTSSLFVCPARYAAQRRSIRDVRRSAARHGTGMCFLLIYRSSCPNGLYAVSPGSTSWPVMH